MVNVTCLVNVTFSVVDFTLFSGRSIFLLQDSFLVI